jgi:GNAT superfamily N-acetyltransferase
VSSVVPLRIALRAYDHPDVARLTQTLQAYYVKIYGGPDTTPMNPSEFAAPHGAFFVGYAATEPVTMGGWRLVAAPVGIEARRPAEIKRMFVVESARGRGYARLLLAHLEDTARAAGADMTVLETGRKQPDAIGLYTSSGYGDVAHFGHYAQAPDARHLGKRL